MCINSPNKPQTYTPSRNGKPSPKTLQERRKRERRAAAKRLAHHTSQESASESPHPQSQPGLPTPLSPTYSAEDNHFGYWGGFSGSEIESADENEQDLFGQPHPGSKTFPQQISYDQHSSSPTIVRGPARQQRRNISSRRSTPEAGTSSGLQSAEEPLLPRLLLADSGTMTDPWEPVHQTIVLSGPGIVTATTEQEASSIVPTTPQNKIEQRADFQPRAL